MADLYCSPEDMEDHVVKDCGVDLAGIVAVAFIDPSVDFETSPESIEDPDTWTALLASSPKLVHIIKNTRGESPKSTPVEQEGFGKNSTRVTGRDHQMHFEFEGIKENIKMVNKLNRKTNYHMVWVTAGGLLKYVDAPVSIDAGIENPRDIKAGEFYSVDTKWTKFDLPGVYTAPEGIFDLD